MNDDTIDSTAEPTAQPDEAQTTHTPPCQAPKPKRKSRAKAVGQAEVKQSEPEATGGERQERVADPMLFAMLLKTHRTMEKEARSAKLSSMRIV
jgi:hypothetical protein